jgi:hypothetical protein
VTEFDAIVIGQDRPVPGLRGAGDKGKQVAMIAMDSRRRRNSSHRFGFTLDAD